LSLDVDMATLPCLLRPRQQNDTTAPAPPYNVGLDDLEQQPERGAVKVEWTGFGAVLMGRTVLERLAAAHPELSCIEVGPRPVPALFHEVIDDGVRFGEDISFCRRWRALGGEIHALLDVEVTHAGLVGHFGREVWAHRAELAQLRDEVVRVDVEWSSLAADLLRLADRAPADADVSAARALVARVPLRRILPREVVTLAAQHHRDFMRATVEAMHTEIGRLRALGSSTALPRVAPAPDQKPLTSRRAPCPCGSGRKFNGCHGAAQPGAAP